MDDENAVEETKDMTVGSDGVMNDAVAKVDTTVAEPEVNEATPPPEPQETVTESSEGEAIEVKVAPPEEKSEESDSTEEPSEGELEKEPEPNETEPDTKETASNTDTSEPAKSSSMAPDAQGSGAPETTSQAAPAEMGVAASQMGKHPHRNNKRLAVIVTLVVAVLLAGTAVAVYLIANSNTESSSNTSADTPGNNAGALPEITPATASDVDKATADVEQAVNGLDESADFADADLTDTTLGL